MDDFGNLTIPGASDGPYTLDATLDEIWVQCGSLEAYGFIGLVCDQPIGVTNG